MTLAVEPESFLYEFITSFLESCLLNGFLSIDEYHDSLARIERDESFAVASRQLLEKAPEAVHLDGYGNLRVIKLSVPSDLQGLFRIQYSSYQDLCRQLYFKIPVFLAHNELH